MKKIMVLAGLILGFFILAGAPALYAKEEFSETSEITEDDGSNFESFAAELDSQPGERAPEVLPMEDTPALEGVAVERSGSTDTQ